nr:MAG TPA: hypothetical protein [Caudoviricetes sp.]
MNKIKILKIICSVLAVSAIATTWTWTYTRSQEEIDKLTNENSVKQHMLEDKDSDLNIALENLQASTDKVHELETSLTNMSKELEEANVELNDLRNDTYELAYMGDFKITYYCDERFNHICGGSGITASGKPTEVGWTVAADWGVLPKGSVIYISGLGFREVQDVGGGVNGDHIDVLVQTHEEALNSGLDYKDVWILVKKAY